MQTKPQSSTLPKEKNAFENQKREAGDSGAFGHKEASVVALTEAEKDFIYCAFRMQMWREGRGTYHNIDDDFAAGLLDEEWRKYVDGLSATKRLA